MDTLDNSSALSTDNANLSLLEGLFELTLHGDTQSWEFQQLDAEIYRRLESAYVDDLGPMVKPGQSMAA